MRLYFYTEGKSNSVSSFRENLAVFNAILSTVEAIKCVRLEMYTNTVHVATPGIPTGNSSNMNPK